MAPLSLYEEWEPRRDWLIGWCGRSELEAEQTTFTELRALEKAHREKMYQQWDMVRSICHNIYLFAPFIEGSKERDRRRFWPLPMDKEIMDRQPLPKMIKVTKREIKAFNDIFKKIHDGTIR